MEPITKIILAMFGNNYPVLSYNISFSQNYNANTGQVVGTPTGSLIDISIVSDGETDFVEWMIGTVEQEEGAIEFYSDDQLVKSISFEEAYLVDYHQNMDKVEDANGALQRVISEELRISYKVIDFDGVEYDKEAMQEV